MVCNTDCCTCSILLFTHAVLPIVTKLCFLCQDAHSGGSSTRCFHCRWVREVALERLMSASSAPTWQAVLHSRPNKSIVIQDQPGWTDWAIQDFTVLIGRSVYAVHGLPTLSLLIKNIVLTKENAVVLALLFTYCGFLVPFLLILLHNYWGY